MVISDLLIVGHAAFMFDVRIESPQTCRSIVSLSMCAAQTRPPIRIATSIERGPKWRCAALSQPTAASELPGYRRSPSSLVISKWDLAGGFPLGGVFLSLHVLFLSQRLALLQHFGL